MSDAMLPVRLWIGVVGHRHVVRSPALLARVTEAIRRIRSEAQRQCKGQVSVGVITAAAEGADRVLTAAILATTDAQLEVVVPMPVAEYERDFADDESTAEFRRLVDRADRLIVGPAQSYRDDGYAWAAERIVARADVLIAVWDGEPARGPGGTGDTVELAADARPPLPTFVLDPAGEQLRLRGELRLDQLRHLARFASSVGGPDRRGSSSLDRTDSAADDPAIADEAAAVRWFARYAERAEAEATRCQRRTRRGGLALIGGAWAATTLAAAHGLLWPDARALGFLEVAVLASLLILLAWLRRGAYHRRWLDARSLAEWCRSALYLHLCPSPAAADERQDFRPGSRHWLARAQEEIWRGRPTPAPPPTAETAATCRRWLDGQVEYYRRQSRRLRRAKSAVDASVWVAFALTIAAVVMAVLAEASEAHHVGTHELAAFAAIVLPAAGGAIAAIRAGSDYQRSADRAERAAADVDQIARYLGPATAPGRVHVLVARAASRLMRENHDWLEVMEYHDPELHP
jgi:hypothetical protein